MEFSSLFVTHPEVVLDPSVPVTQWRLSGRGRRRAQAFADSISGQGWDLVVSSGERKAVETAEILSVALGLPFSTDERLGENDRTATGFLPPDEFERTAARFFAFPDKSIRGWETATHAQARIVDAVCHIVAGAPDRRIVFVSHGAVGSLLLSHLRAIPINRDLDQPRLGCCFAFDPTTSSCESAWRPLPDV